MIARISFPTIFNNLKILLPNISIYYGKKTWSHLPILLQTFQHVISSWWFLQTSYLKRPLSLNYTMQTKEPAKNHNHVKIKTRYTRDHFLCWKNFQQKIFKIFSFYYLSKFELYSIYLYFQGCCQFSLRNILFMYIA